ncbi:MAG: hypothetical protein HYZ28_26775 [Myxococcales bacterium]|nr:hypothetical protein [Myxococcales bacterium]
MRRAGLVAFLVMGVATAQEKAPEFSIVEIRPMLFERESGDLRPLPEPDARINLFGDLAVVVKVKGRPGSFAKGRKLRVQVSDGKRELVSQTQELEGIGVNGHAHRLVFVPMGILCGELKVSARIDQPKPSAKELALSFACGE